MEKLVGNLRDALKARLQKLDWMVVKDIFVTETADVWKTPGTNPTDVKTEVFSLPAAPAAEKDGSLTNTMRLIQWHEKAVNPPGDVTSDAEFFVSLAKRLQKMYAGSKRDRDKGFLAANFQYGDNPKEPNMELVLKEINGFTVKDGKLTVNGTLNSTPNATFTVHWYFSTDSACANNQLVTRPLCAFGACGKIPGVTTDSSGNAAFSIPFNFPPSTSSGVINCTATDADGNTSEFSACLPVSASPTP